MGKVRKGRNPLTARTDPVGLDSAIAELRKGMDQDEELVPDSGSGVETVLEQLQSARCEDRVCGCISLSRHAASAKFRQTALDNQVARVCAPLLGDTDSMVQLAAVGALKNLSVADPDTAETLVSQDVMTPLCALLSSYSHWEPGQDSDPKQDTALSILIQALDLLWNLVEASNTALNIFNSHGLLDLVLRYISPTLPPSLVQSSLSTLAAVSDSNPAVADILLARQEELLILAREPAPLLSRLTVSVIMLHLHGSSLYSSPSSLALILEIVSLGLAEDTEALLHLPSPSVQGEGMEVGEGEEEGEETVAAHIQETLRAQVTALEVLINLGSLEEEEDWEDEDSEDSDDGENGEEIKMEDGDKRMEVNPMFAEMVVGRGLVGRVLAVAGDLTEEVKTSWRESPNGRSILAQHQSLRTRAFLCLANLTELLSVADLGGVQSLYQTWTSLGNLCFNTKCVDEDLLEAVTSAMRATTQKICADSTGGEVFRLNSCDLESILALYSRASQASVRTNTVHIVGEAASMAARYPGDTVCQEVLGRLAVWLVDTAAKDRDLIVSGEALDKFMDVFTEDSSDLLFARLGLLHKLKHIMGPFKSRVEQNKKVLGPAFPLLHQAKSNLHRFIKYKQKRPAIAAAAK